MWIYYLPIATTAFSVFFARLLFREFSKKSDSLHLLWWGIGVVTYGVGTFLEASITLLGWNEFLFRSWYIAGALMGGAPLAQGTVYLLMKRRLAHFLTGALVCAIMFGATMVILTPLDYSLVNPYLPQGKVIIWKWVRFISPFINTYAVIFLIGGAIYSAVRYLRLRVMQNRVVGNTLIAIGAILPGIGGAMSRAGHTEVLYVAELVGLLLIFFGYRHCVKETVDETAGEFADVLASPED